MPDPERRCSSCWWYSSNPGEQTGYCYEKDLTATDADAVCEEWDDKTPETLKQPAKA